MLEAQIRSFSQRCCLALASLAAVASFSSCASSKPQTALVGDPDAQAASSIPWNKPANWEGRGNLPPGLGTTSQGDAFGGDNPGGTGGY